MRIALFDLDNTLYDREATFRRWADRFASDHQLEREATEWLVHADQDGFAERTELWANAKDHFGLREPVGTLVSAYYEGYWEMLNPESDVHNCLAELQAADWRICIITNGPQTHQLRKAERLGLLPLVNGFCSSGELGIAKPDPRIFEEALRRAVGEEMAGTRPESRWMIGDSPTADIIGGRQCELGTIWIHRNRTWDRTLGSPPDLFADSIREVVRHLLEQE
jgi:putative hydrolase of the HAD superfamily